MDRCIVENVTQWVTDKKEGLSPLLNKNDSFDSFIGKVKNGFIKGLSVYQSCYTLLYYSDELLNIYRDFIPVTLRSFSTNDSPLSTSFYSFLLSLNKDFFQMFRVMDFERLVVGMFLVIEWRETVNQRQHLQEVLKQI